MKIPKISKNQQFKRPLYKNCGWWKNYDYIFGFSVKSYVRNTKNLSCAKILLTSVTASWIKLWITFRRCPCYLVTESVSVIHHRYYIDRVRGYYGSVYRYYGLGCIFVVWYRRFGIPCSLKSRDLPKDPNSRMFRNVDRFLILSLFRAVNQYRYIFQQLHNNENKIVCIYMTLILHVWAYCGRLHGVVIKRKSSYG